MTLHDLIKRSRGTDEYPVLSLQHDMNRLFEDFFSGSRFPSLFERKGAGALAEFATPQVDISETETEVRISAELPGMTEKEIDVTLAEGALTIRGEKKVERNDEKENYHVTERSYGSFQRTLTLPCEVDRESVDATFTNGVLNIVLKKVETESPKKKIDIKRVD